MQGVQSSRLRVLELSPALQCELALAKTAAAHEEGDVVIKHRHTGIIRIRHNRANVSTVAFFAASTVSTTIHWQSW